MVKMKTAIATVRIDKQCRVTIPEATREILGIDPGDLVELVITVVKKA
jgi:AbrB family looped-hinge helix DNA binding protein